MKIIITGTDQDKGREVMVSIPGDDMTIDKVIELFADALKGWSFDATLVNRYLLDTDIEEGRN